MPADVTLLVSKGSPLTTVPDLSGRHIDDALELLARVRPQPRERSATIPCRSTPPGGSSASTRPEATGCDGGDPVEVRVAGRPEEVNRSRPDPSGATRIPNSPRSSESPWTCVSRSFSNWGYKLAALVIVSLLWLSLSADERQSQPVRTRGGGGSAGLRLGPG